MEKLLKLSKQTIPTFLEMYKAASYPRHALTYSAFKNYDIQTEKFPEINNNLELLTLNDDWQKDGLFLMKNGRSYYFDSLEPEPFHRVKKLLLNIDYSKEVVFRAVRDQFKPIMNDVLWLKNLEITDQTGTTTNIIKREDIFKLPIHPLPEGWLMRSLSLDDVPQINENLLREGGDNIGYVENSIKYKLTLGVFDENGKLQAWIFGVDLGVEGSLGTTDHHKRKGAASACAVKFAQTVLTDLDVDFVWNVAHGEDSAEGFARKFKGIPISTVTWMAVNKRVSKKMTQMGMYQIFYPKL